VTVTPRDRWARADAYERYVGRWSRPVAAGFLSWLGVPPGNRWLDVGCGTGALTRAVLERWPARVVGVDLSRPFLAAAAEELRDPRVALAVADARALPLPTAGIDVAVSGLALNFVPDPAAGLAEAVRVVRHGGLVAAYVWDYAEGMGMLRAFWDAAAALDPAAAALDEGVRFPLCRPEPLAGLAEAAGLRDVAVTGLVVPTVFTDLDDLWAPFLGGAGPAPSYVATLPDDAREALRSELAARVTPADDGTLCLTARAWAVRGVRP
jgi:SAM-dependent methyltransferase